MQSGDTFFVSPSPLLVSIFIRRPAARCWPCIVARVTILWVSGEVWEELAHLKPRTGVTLYNLGVRASGGSPARLGPMKTQLLAPRPTLGTPHSGWGSWGVLVP